MRCPLWTTRPRPRWPGYPSDLSRSASGSPGWPRTSCPPCCRPERAGWTRPPRMGPTWGGGGGRVRFLSRRLAAGLVAVAATGALLALGVGAGYPAERPRLLSGAAWLPSSQVGQLTLLDGASAEVAAQVQVAPTGHDLHAVQEGSTGYAVDRSAGSIRRVDGATFETTAPVTPIPGAQAGLEVFAGHDSVYALDTRRGVLTGADPRTLANRGGPVPLAARVTPAAATVDSAGGLWLLDTPTGDLVWFRDGQRRVRRNASTPRAGLLTLAGGGVGLVDTRRRPAPPLDPGAAAPRDPGGAGPPAGRP